VDVLALVIRLVSNVLTLYMMLVLLRWVGPWLQIDLKGRRFRWIALLTDPLVDRLRKALPPMGPMDFGPIAALFILWVARTLVVSVLIGMRSQAL